jgi:hypothetical protein
MAQLGFIVHDEYQSDPALRKPHLVRRVDVSVAEHFAVLTMRVE